MGGVVMNVDARGRRVSAVGTLGFAWNWPRFTQHWHQIGYPAAFPFNGLKQVVCSSSHNTNDFSLPDPGFVGDPDTVGTGCDMTGGSSGGPWIKDFSGVAGASNFLNGNVSYGYINPSEPEQMYSPYFGDFSKALRDALIGGTP